MASRRQRIAATVTSTVAMIGAGLAVVSVPAQAAPVQGFAPCAPAYPLTKVENGATTSNLTPGQKVTGLTSVDSGDPVEFTGTYVGTIDNGIADGLDMLVFDLKGPRITGPDDKVAAGTWSGISGSPIYDDATGDLVGSVSYGFTSALSPRAGVTPASYLYDLSPSGPAASLATARTTVKATRSESAAISRASDLPGALGTGHVLQPAKQVSGVTPSIASTIADKSRLMKKSPSLSGGYRAGTGGGGSDVDYPIVPGGSIALTASTGNVTNGMVGTVTAVCGDQVFAFGHPGTFSGASTATFNGAQTVMIQEDGVLSPSFKVANIGRVKGVITEDRLTGIVGTLGKAPATVATVTTKSTGPRLKAPRTTSTSVSQQEVLPFTVGSQVAMDAVTVLNQYGAGDALLTWKITYKRASSASVKTFTRTQRYSAGADFPEAVSFDAASDVESLLGNKFEKVVISAVNVTAAYQPTYLAAAPKRVQQYVKGSWRYVGARGVSAKPGSTIVVRLRLGAAEPDSAAPTTFTGPIRFKTSKSARGTGKVVFEGQAVSSDDFEDFDFDDLASLLTGEEDGEEIPRPRTLDQLLALLGSQPRQDDVVGTFTYKNRYGKLERQRSVRAANVTTGTVKLRVHFRR